ncbi:hypothetical protein N7492_005534 [Penicillium capsulatum]|uniref:Uncharacterized protein n=1 Tax=Penicillium capsulatum TaxID=69766 RepID=A0A9W9IA07_9EURO|nr:hypothetical protein N7492_005534 [Penicillium capsulatum]
MATTGPLWAAVPVPRDSPPPRGMAEEFAQVADRVGAEEYSILSYHWHSVALDNAPAHTRAREIYGRSSQLYLPLSSLYNPSPPSNAGLKCIATIVMPESRNAPSSHCMSHISPYPPPIPSSLPRNFLPTMQASGAPGNQAVRLPRY